MTRKCCACNGPSASCRNCKCVKSNNSCSNCYPSYHGRCSNIDVLVPDSQPLNNNGTTLDSRFSELACEETFYSTEEIYDRIRRKSTRVIKRIPRGAREVFGNLLISCLNNIVSDWKESKYWEMLFSLPLLALAIPNVHKTGTLTSVIKQQCSNFHTNFSNNVTFRKKPNTQRKGLQCGEERRAKLITEKLEDHNIKGAIRLAAGNNKLAPFTAETAKLLEEKHPTGETILAQLDSNEPPLAIFKDHIEKSIASFPAGSGSGIDGLRAQHLKDILQCQTIKENLLTSLQNFCNLLLSGNVPEHIKAILFGASLIALEKPSGGIRPIAVGMTLRRLVAKCAAHIVKEKIKSVLLPEQLGVSVKSGAECGVHSLRSFLNSIKDKNDFVTVKYDFKNAFNSLHRTAILNVCSEHLPTLLPFVALCYSQPSILSFGDFDISSSSGIQQGDPLGPALFCLAINKIVKSLNSPFNVWYLDDGTIGGDINDVLSDHNTIKTLGQQLGLHLNESKCEIIGFHHTSIQAFLTKVPEAKVVPPDFCTLLGAPIFSDGVKVALKEKANTFDRLSKRLLLIHPQEAFFILKNCWNTQLFNYHLRAADCYKQTAALKEIDGKIYNCISRILNLSVNHDIKNQISLPVKCGGLGIRACVDIAAPAYCSSINSSIKTCLVILKRCSPESIEIIKDTQNTALEYFSNKLGKPIPEGNSFTKQHQFDTLMTTKSMINITKSSLQKQKLVSAASTNYSGSWLNALPIQNLGLKLSPLQFKTAVALRVGQRVSRLASCACGNDADEFGHHFLSCRLGRAKQDRHQQCNKIISSALHRAGVPNIQEPNDFSHLSLRPDGLTTIPFQCGKLLSWDFTCCDTLAESYQGLKDTAANTAETKKLKKYERLKSDCEFIPIGCETLGGWGSKGIALLKKIASLIRQRTGEKRAFSFLMQQLSIAIQRGNSNCILQHILKEDEETDILISY